MGLGGLGLGGLCLPELLNAQSAIKKQGDDFATDKSVILLFLHGGPSQIETFDPKMSAPAGIRSATGEVQTSIPGLTFGGSFPKLAKLADRLAIVRSFASGDGNHDIKPVVGKTTFGANIGSVYSRVVGANDPKSGIPKNVGLFPRSVDSSAQKRTSQFGKFESVGALGNAYAPFIPGAGGPAQEDMKLHLNADRLDDRKTLLTQLDIAKRQQESLQGVDRVRDQAFSTILVELRMRLIFLKKIQKRSLDMIRHRSYDPTRSVANGTTTTTMLITRSRWANCFCWLAASANEVVDSLPYQRTLFGTCMPMSTMQR